MSPSDVNNENWTDSGERYSMEEIARSVGNAKTPGEFGRDGAALANPNTNDARPLSSNPALGREEALSLLSQKMARLPAVPKKILAMHFHDHIPLCEIAACLGVTESLICQVQAQTVELLRNYLLEERRNAQRTFSQESDLVVSHPSTGTFAKT
jgi:DNA-directed RNA polymerase specialized sigma24 family protein